MSGERELDRPLGVGSGGPIGERCGSWFARWAVGATLALLAVMGVPTQAVAAEPEYQQAHVWGWTVSEPDTGHIYHQEGTRHGFEIEQIDTGVPVIESAAFLQFSYYTSETLQGTTQKIEALLHPGELRTNRPALGHGAGLSFIVELPPSVEPDTEYTIELRTEAAKRGSSVNLLFGTFAFRTAPADIQAPPGETVADAAPQVAAPAAPSSADAAASGGTDVVAVAPQGDQPAGPAVAPSPEVATEPEPYVYQAASDRGSVPDWVWPYVGGGVALAALTVIAVRVVMNISRNRRLRRLGERAVDA